MEDYSGEHFLREKVYKDLHKSDAVKKFSKKSNNPEQNIRAYFEGLMKFENNEDERVRELFRWAFYEKYIINIDDIDINLCSLAHETPNSVIDKQKKGMDEWLNELKLFYDNGYPYWTLYWAFQGMLKMGDYDEVRKQYNRRSKKTIKEFVEMDASILLETIELIIKYTNGKKIDDNEVERLVEKGSFSKIYGTLLQNKKSKAKIESNPEDGIWIKYNQGSKEDAIKLCQSLQENKPCWCTTNVNMALQQVCGPYISEGVSAPQGGDFYVYYTKDTKGEYTLPRIAIRMINNNQIGEIRGIENGQNLEISMLSILTDKLNNIATLTKDDRTDALEKVDNLRVLSEINKKYKKGELLTKEEALKFYSVKKFGFGWSDCKIAQDLDGLPLYNILDENLKRDKDVILAAIKKNESIMEYVPTDIKEYEEIAFILVKNNPRAIKYVAEEKRTRELYLFVVSVMPELIEIVPLDFEKYNEIVINAVSNNSQVIKLIPKEKITPELGEIAVKQNCLAIEYVPTDLSNYDELVLIAVKQNGLTIQYVPTDLSNYEELVLIAVKQNGLAIQYVPTDLSNYEELVLIAVKQNGLSLKYIHTNINNYENIVKVAIMQNGDALQFISSTIENYRELALMAVSQNGISLRYVPDDFIDFEMAKIAVKQNNAALQFVPTDLEGYEDIANLGADFLDKNEIVDMGGLSVVIPKELFKNSSSNEKSR